MHSGSVSASDVMRMLKHGGQPTHLGQALAHFGRIFKTLDVLSIDGDPVRYAGSHLSRSRVFPGQSPALARHGGHANCRQFASDAIRGRRTSVRESRANDDLGLSWSAVRAAEVTSRREVGQLLSWVSYARSATGWMLQ